MLQNATFTPQSRGAGTKLYRTTAAQVKEELTPQNTKVAIASSKSSSSTSRYFCKADKVLCPEIFWITFNGTPRTKRDRVLFLNPTQTNFLSRPVIRFWLGHDGLSS
jgi:hypothetical protein